MSEDKKEEKKFKVNYSDLKPLEVKKSKGKFKNITFHPGVTLLFATIKDVSFQLKDGLWKLKM